MIYLAGARPVAVGALDADDGVDDLLPAVDLLAFVVGDAHEGHLVQHGADAGTLRCKNSQLFTSVLIALYYNTYRMT